jgi:hypothetical protein
MFSHDSKKLVLPVTTSANNMSGLFSCQAELCQYRNAVASGWRTEIVVLNAPFRSSTRRYRVTVLTSMADRFFVQSSHAVSGEDYELK